MHTIQKELNSEKFTVLIITTYVNKNDVVKKTINKRLNGQEINFPVLIGGEHIQKLFKEKVTPSTFIIDKQGFIKYKHINFEEGLCKYFRIEIQSLL